MSDTSKTDYFDIIIDARQKGEAWVGALGDFNHWGYWDAPERSRGELAELEPSQQNLTDELLSFAKLRDGQRMLDVGCGLGGTLRTVDGMHQNMALYGLDFDHRLAEVTRNNVLGSGTNTVEIRQGCATKLPWDDATMDVVTAVECIFHFPNREQFLTEAWRVLKPGGKLVICDFAIANVPNALKGRRPLLTRTSAVKWLGRTDFIGIQDYQQLSKETGFERMLHRDITLNTLPTYNTRVAFFKSTGLPWKTIGPRIAGMRLAELTSRMGIFKYVIFAFEKGKANGGSHVD